MCMRANQRARERVYYLTKKLFWGGSGDEAHTYKDRVKSRYNRAAARRARLYTGGIIIVPKGAGFWADGEICV